MNKVKCFIIDDERHSANILAKYIARTPGLELIGIDTDPQNAYELISQRIIRPDICFVDINMEELNGLVLAEKLKEFTLIIFQTGYPEYGAKAYDLEAVDYLVKPITFERFMQAIHAISMRPVPVTLNRDRDYFFFKTDGRGNMQKGYKREVLYIESGGNYIRLCMERKTYTVYLTLKEMIAKLHGLDLVRVHRACIINIAKIERIQGDVIEMENGEKFSLGENYREPFMKAIAPFLLLSDRRR